MAVELNRRGAETAAGGLWHTQTVTERETTPDEHSPVRHILVLRRIDPEQNLSRFYTLVIERDLFGQVVLVRSWGRIGARGRKIVEPYLDELETGAALERIAARKRRRGYRDL